MSSMPASYYSQCVRFIRMHFLSSRVFRINAWNAKLLPVPCRFVARFRHCTFVKSCAAAIVCKYVPFVAVYASHFHFRNLF